MLAVVVQIGGPHVNVSEKTLGLITEHKRFTRDLLGSIVTAFSLLAVAWTLLYLWDAARAREPNLRPWFVGWIAVAGGVIQGISVIAYVIAFGSAARFREPRQPDLPGGATICCPAACWSPARSATTSGCSCSPWPSCWCR